MIVEQRIDGMIMELRQSVGIDRVLAAATAVIDERDKLEAKLAAGMHLQLDDEASTEKWLRWLKCYESLCDSLNDARPVLAS